MSTVGGTPLLLVLDDDSAVRRTWAIILEQKGYTVIAVERGEEAVAVARQHNPDLLLADIRLPDMTGVEAARQVAEVAPRCRILLISGDSDSNEILEQARAEGASFEVLPKPISPPELLARIGERLRRAS